MKRLPSPALMVAPAPQAVVDLQVGQGLHAFLFQVEVARSMGPVEGGRADDAVPDADLAGVSVSTMPPAGWATKRP